MAIHLLGIRHHGPGSCRNVLHYLKELKPDLILLEGPAEAEPLLSHICSEQMEPPVALLAYRPEEPQHAVFYPFADFSPEWQTLRYALQYNIPLRFFDLPLTHSLALDQQQTEPAEQSIASIPESEGDPFDWLAKATGYADGEAWWEATIEQRQDNADIFQAVQEAVTALREELPDRTRPRDLLREAWMRRTIRTSQKENFERIAVVCGAWHVPALVSFPTVKEDNELLKGLPKVKITCTWIPWTYDRLALRSGYGAGIESPGWYHYLWHHPEDDGTYWISQVASLLRTKNMDISVAHIIETVRLAQTAAALRNLPAPTLTEYNEAITTVMGFGDNMLLQLIREELVISDRLGHVPTDVPQVSLLTDIQKTQKRLRVPFTAEIKELILDLRKPGDLERSIFFHRLHLLGIDWCLPGQADGKGTFKEKWTLYHKPEQILDIIEKALWGNTLEEATQKYLLKETSDMRHIPDLTHLLNRVIPANLSSLVEAMTLQLDRLSAASSDILEMMEAIPDLVSIVRYGNVRNLDFSQVGNMLRAMIARILAGGILICIHIDEDAAADILEKLIATDYAVSTLNTPELNDMWQDFIRQIRTSTQVHPLLCGYATRLANDKGEISPEEMQNILSFYTSPGNTPADMAYWIEGFLRSSGTVLLLDDHLWELINHWICVQEKETFIELLPILKRTFSEFSPAERRKLGEKAKASGKNGRLSATPLSPDCHEEEASRVIPLIYRLLGIEMK